MHWFVLFEPCPEHWRPTWKETELRNDFLSKTAVSLGLIENINLIEMKIKKQDTLQSVPSKTENVKICVKLLQ